MTAIDASGVLPDGTRIDGMQDLRQALVARSDMFVQTLTENLMIYALGRAVDYRDMPTIRGIVRKAEADDYRFDSIIYNIVSSPAFRMQARSLSETGEATKQQAAL